MLEQEPCGPEEPSISDSKAVSDSDDEHYETVGPYLAARYIVQQDFCRSSRRNSIALELPRWRTSCKLTRTDCGLDLVMEDNGTPYEMGGSSSPVRAAT